MKRTRRSYPSPFLPRRFRRVTVVPAIAFTACADPVPPPVPTTLTVSPSSAELAAVGGTVQLTATVKDQNGKPMPNAAVMWSSGATGVATVDARGLVTAAGNGRASITAKAETAEGTAAVTVAQKADSVIVSPTADTITPSDTLRLTARAFDANGHPIEHGSFTWTSGDAATAVVDGSGLVTGQAAEGTATITAKSGAAEGTARITVVNPDRAVLVAFHKATGGDAWGNNGGWLSDQPLDLWYGVETDRWGYVRVLDLWDNDLTGSIPPELGQLASLRGLYLTDNDLTGSIPPELGQLASLRDLYSRRQRSHGPDSARTRTARQPAGPVPLGQRPDGFRFRPNSDGSTALGILYLSNNGLTGPIPPELGRLSALGILDLRQQRSDGPDSARTRTARQHCGILYLSNNGLTGPIPPELGRLDRTARYLQSLQQPT